MTGSPWLRERIALDLYCKAGGSGKVYVDAGCLSYGIDCEPQPNYPYPILVMDAIEALTRLLAGEGLTFSDGRTLHLHDFTFIGASPPCQLFTEGAPGRKKQDHPDLLTPTRMLLVATGLPYAIENVVGAPMPNAVLLCGSTFGLPVIRHRLLEINPDPVLVPSLCHQKSTGRGVAHKGRYSYGHGRWRDNWRKHVLPVVWPWMTIEESGQAVPPPYTKFAAESILGVLAERDAA